MLVKDGIRDSNKCMITLRALFLFLIVTLAIFTTAISVEAKGVPTNLIIFTDKKVYTDAVNNPRSFDTDNPAGSRPVPNAASTDDFKMILYAIILDDEGNILSGNQSVNFTVRSVDDVKVLDHGTITDTATHHTTVTNNPSYLNGAVTVPALLDNGQGYDTNANDGVYTAYIDLPDYSINKGGSGGSVWDRWQIGTNTSNTMDQTNAHLLVAVNVTFNNSVNPKLNGTTYILFTQYNCHQAFEGTHPSAHTGTDGTGTSANNFEPCDICHIGYDHLYNYMNFSEFPGNFGDVAHANKLKPPSSLGNIVTANSADVQYNTTYAGNTSTEWQITNWSVFLKQGDKSDYCYVCHFNAGSETLDYQGASVRGDLTDRPSCSVASKSLRGGTANVNCHLTTNISGTVIPPWEPAAANSTHMVLANTTASRSHKISTSNPNLPCAGCHLTIHSIILPNRTSDYNINDQCKYCHSNTGPQNSTKTAHSSGTPDCKGCHKNATGVLDAHDVPIGVSGGANCTDCHTSAGINVSSGGGKLINSTAMNISGAIHRNLNINAVSTGIPVENRKCWACHGNGSRPGGEHPDNYKTPFNCTSCHVPGIGQNLNYSPNNTLLNVTQHYWNGTSIHTPAATTCYLCHNRSEMMLGASLDPDGAGTVYGGANGGNNSTSHYGKNRTDLRTWNSSRAVNCSYCHQNTSTTFAVAMIDPGYNRSIQNHSAGNSPVCFNSTCHGSGWIHNSTLTRPSLPLPNSTYCQLCHPEKQKHNGTQNCTQCHINTISNDSIHPIKFLQTNGSFIASNSSAVNCTNCHQGAGFANFSSAPIIPNPLKHSSNISNGTIWGTYWATGNSSCYYCHSNTKHNSTALGNISALLNSYNVRNGTLTTTQWCADCHYNDSLNTDFRGSLWNPAPPYISYDNTLKSGWIDHTDYLSSGYNDSDCKNCHAMNGSYTATSLNYSHSLDPGAGGGPDCINCHNLVTGLTGGAPVGINFTAANASSHNGTNSNNATSRGYAPIIGACWACHDSDGNVTSGHPDRYKTPRKCDDCHLASGSFYSQSLNWGGLAVAEHYSNGTDIKAGNSTANISSCINCHENVTEMISYNNDTDYGSFTGDGIRLKGGNLSFYHYGKNRTDIRTGNSSNCSYCHQNTSTVFAVAMINSSYNRSIGNHSNYSSNPGCTSSQCHNTGWIHNSTLTKPGFGIPDSTFCLSCHGKNSTSGLINFTGAITSIKEKHNNSMNCTECHMDTVKDIHPVKYLLQDATYSTLNTSSVTCITCHQTSSVDAALSLSPPKIPAPMHHSDNAANGTIWNSTAYWTPSSLLTSCTYCHNDTKHNASALGRPAGWQGNNAVNSSLGTGTWCSSCHYRNYSSGGKNYGDMTQAFTSANLSVPPEITNGSYAFKIYNRSNYYNHSLTDYSDSVCRLCHGINLSSTSTASELMHNITTSSCTGCHYSFEAMNNTTRPDRYVDFSMYNTSLHRSLSCTDCHTQGHKNMGARKACEDCHAVQADPIIDKDRHNITTTPSTYFVGASNVIGITDCTTCHDSVLYNKSISTYGYWKPKDCDYCHSYPDKYYE